MENLDKKQLAQFRVTYDSNDPGACKVIDIATGKAVEYISRVDFSLTTKGAVLTLELVHFELDINMKGTIEETKRIVTYHE
jgi:hypothetical protein